MSELQGRRVEDDDSFWEAGPGAYMRVTLTSGDHPEPVVAWHVSCPGCGSNMHLGGAPLGSKHFVKENEDGTITIALHPPEEPTNSNSTLCPSCGWHGQCIDGVWSTV